MRRNRIHFHHFPGHEHVCGHCCDHGEAAGTVRAKEQTIQLLESLCLHGEEHASELAGYRDEIEDQSARGLLAESLMFLNRSNIKLGDAIAALKRTS